MGVVHRLAHAATIAALLLSVINCGGSPNAPSPSGDSKANDQQTGPSAGTYQNGLAASVNLNGTVSSVDVDARTFVVDGRVVQVPATTVIEANDHTTREFSDIFDGTRVHVKGTAEITGVVAYLVTLRDVTIRGFVSRVSGTCPDLTFALQGHQVATNSASSFGPGVCQDVIDDADVEVKGSVAGGVLTAARVEVPVIDRPAPKPPKTGVEVTGPVSDVNGSCPDVSFTIGTQPVVANAATGYSVGSCADIVSGVVVEVRGTLADGILTSTRIEVPSTPSPAPKPQVMLTGTIGALAGACPDATLQLGSTAIATNATTEYARGTCADLADGRTVEVRGERNADRTVTASVIAFENVYNPVPPPSPIEVEFNGVVSAMAGDCPAKTLSIASGTIHVTAATKYPGAACWQLTLSSVIDGRGVVQQDGSILALQLHVRQSSTNPAPGGPKDVRLEGPVSAVTGSCPSLSFTLAGQSVQTTAATQFVGSGHCGLIVNGKPVDVTGTENAGVITATRVKVSK